MKFLKNLTATTIISVSILISFLAISLFWKIFIDICPAKDVLSWDANLRMIYVLDQYQDLRDGRLIKGLLPFFDSPTWPTLRSVFSLSVIAFHGGPEMILDVGISFVFFILLIVSIHLIAFRISSSFLSASVLSIFTTVMLLHTRQIPAFALSSMLETQGMFFFIWTMYYLYRLYCFPAHPSTPEKSDAVKSEKRLALGLFISSQGLFHTKYPYGLMLIIAACLCEVVMQRRIILEFIRLLLERQSWIRLSLMGLFCLLILLLAVGGRIPFLDIKSKIFKYSVYVLFLFLFVDLNIFIAKNRAQLKSFFPKTTVYIYLFIVLPMLAWMLLHPDRMSSTLGTQMHVQEETRSFTASLFFDVFDSTWPVVGIAIGIATGVFYYAVRRILKSADSGGEKALLTVTVIFILQFEILEILTKNKQLRHIYHMLPIMILLGAFWWMRVSSTLLLGRTKNIQTLISGAAGAVLLVLASVVLKQPSGLLAESYPNARFFCWTGTEGWVYDGARWIAGLLDTQKKYIVINSFHEPFAQLPGRALATEVDLLSRIRSFQRGMYRNDAPYAYRDWSEFDELLLITAHCNDAIADAKLHARTEQTKSSIMLLSTTAHETGQFCLKKYSILKY